MPFSITCPSCDARLTAPDGVAGKRVKCKSCGEAFVARPPVPGEDEPTEQLLPLHPSPGEDDPPGRPARRPPDDDTEIDRPVRRPRYDDGDEDETRPRGRRRPPGRKRSGGRVLLFVLLGAFGFLLCCGGGVGFGIYSLLAERTFTDFSPPDGSFTAKFPGSPRRTVQAGSPFAGGPTERVLYSVPTWGATYEVGVFSLGPDKVGGEFTDATARVFLDAMADALSRDMAFTVTKTTTVTHQGHTGRELELRTNKGEQGVVRLFVTRRHVFFVCVSRKSSPPDPAKVKTFYDNFRIADPPVGGLKLK